MQIYSDKSFSNPIEIIQAEGDLEEAFAKIDKLRKKYYLLGYVTYDFKKLYFEVFDKYESERLCATPSLVREVQIILKLCSLPQHPFSGRDVTKVTERERVRVLQYVK